MNERLEISTIGAVRLIRMTGSPRRGNPLSQDLIGGLLEAVIEGEEDKAVRAIVLAGTDTHFSVGADLHEVDRMTASEAILDDWLDEFDRIAAARKPMIAAVRGHAVGGGFELALTCDLMICADDARLSLPETGIGVIAGQGGTQRIIQLAGKAIAADMILTGRVVFGDEACQLGIAARSVPSREVIEESINIASAIAERSPEAIRFSREVLREASEGHLRQSMRIERLLASVVLDTQERKKRVGEFLDKSRKSK
ncbi:enoyl-CoA hydratase/isomerase family protein [Litchfieldella xinjiangensis]|uniref:enoyl-CoA hydratase/isomerase family protein n=1 Tax=Litchfieldella xinjiangensis TaxID=1166948 RepID=UPI0005BD1842|nr:enoyl-CoA hydratase/isomerase family protein [Halomonas xinjiangensis]